LRFLGIRRKKKRDPTKKGGEKKLVEDLQDKGGRKFRFRRKRGNTANHKNKKRQRGEEVRGARHGGEMFASESKQIKVSRQKIRTRCSNLPLGSRGGDEKIMR